MAIIQAKIKMTELKIEEDKVINEKNHKEEMAFLTKTNLQLKRQIESIMSNKQTL